jgi:hypothetical protein
MAARMYDPSAAQATDLNLQTVMMWDEYMARMTHESARLHHRRGPGENPGEAEVESGDALNITLADLSHPRLGSAALRAAIVPVPTSLIAELPFRSDTERVILMLDDLRGAIWPDVFKGEGLAGYKKVFDDLRRIQNIRRIRPSRPTGSLARPDRLGSDRSAAPDRRGLKAAKRDPRGKFLSASFPGC